MKDGKATVPLTEPIPVPCLFVTGGIFEVSAGSVRWVGWVDLPDLGGETRERRIVCRLAMTRKNAREIAGLLDDALDDGG